MGPKNKGSITRCTEFGRTPLSDIFRGQLRSRILRQGDQSTDNVQPFFTLQLDIEVPCLSRFKKFHAKDKLIQFNLSTSESRISESRTGNSRG